MGVSGGIGGGQWVQGVIQLTPAAPRSGVRTVPSRRRQPRPPPAVGQTLRSRGRGLSMGLRFDARRRSVALASWTIFCTMYSARSCTENNRSARLFCYLYAPPDRSRGTTLPPLETVSPPPLLTKHQKPLTGHAITQKDVAVPGTCSPAFHVPSSTLPSAYRLVPQPCCLSRLHSPTYAPPSANVYVPCPSLASAFHEPS